MQHPIVATYPEVTTFSLNQTELTIKVGICCNFLSERLSQWLQLFFQFFIESFGAFYINFKYLFN